MNAYNRFKEDLVKNALDTIKAFEVELREVEERQGKDTEKLLQRVESLQNEILTLRSENHEWACKYEALTDKLSPQLLPETGTVGREQSSKHQPDLADFAQLVQDNQLFRRKYRVARDELRSLRALYGLRTPEAHLRGLESDQSQAKDEHRQLPSEYHKADDEIPAADSVDENSGAKSPYLDAQPHVKHDRCEEDATSRYTLLQVGKMHYAMIDVDKASTAIHAEEPLTPVSNSFKGQQNQVLINPGQKLAAEEPNTSDDETSSETQFSDAGTQRVEFASQEIIAEDSDDPVVVSARPTKRKRAVVNDVKLPPSKTSRSDNVGLREPKNVHIKLESSSQCGEILPPSTNRVNETVDLDEVGSRIKTPKKSRQSLQGTTSPESRPSDSSGESQEEMLDDGYDYERQYGRSQSAPVSRTTARFALQPKDPNTLLRKAQQKSHQTTGMSLKVRRIRRDQRSAAVGIMGEDGESAYMSRKAISDRKGQDKPLDLEVQAESAQGRTSNFNQRLEKAMDDRPAQTPFLTAKIQPRSNRTLTTPKISTPKRAQEGVLELAPSKADQLRAKVSNTFQMPPCENISSRRQKEQLRSRPPETLSLGDFVMNPNSRMSFAYTEPVRSRDQRKCLSTCTKPECCGARYLKITQIGGIAPLRSGLWSSSPPNEEEADEVSLLEHLNNDYAQLRSMSRTDKDNMLAQIRAQQMGNAIGKHKLTGYERAQTPPGFWRADMPSTQEVEADRKEAKGLERQKVQERWHEAMADDGKGLWKFRDE